MRLIGVNRSPYTRRVAIALCAYAVPFEQSELNGFGHREAVRALNPLGRIPALELDDGEVLVDSGAILDHLDEVHGGSMPLAPRGGPERRAVLRVAALAMGACDKGLQAAYHRNHVPAERRHQPWIEDCLAQMGHALGAIDALLEPNATHLLLGHLTHADIAAFVAERLARGLGIDTATRMPRLRTQAKRLLELAPFATTEPAA
ncbi:MAG: glutathione S-transferase family protein [Alphaproteobacteria bacterium]|nr:glutathione S-transferase family protein [Alphaproteobacteria bacterium]